MIKCFGFMLNVCGIINFNYFILQDAPKVIEHKLTISRLIDLNIKVDKKSLCTDRYFSLSGIIYLSITKFIIFCEVYS